MLVGLVAATNEEGRPTPVGATMTQTDDRTATAPRSTAVAVLLIFVYILIAAAPLIAALVTRSGQVSSFPQMLGSLLALVALPLLGLQIVLAGRLAPVTRHYGLEMVLRFHKAMAVVALVVLMSHPLLLAWGQGSLSLLISLDQPWYIWLGKVGLALLLIQVVVALLWRRFLVFERWRALHNLGVVLVVLAAVHAAFVSSEVRRPAVAGVLVALGAVILGVYVFHKLLAPKLADRRRYRVSAVEREADRVWTVALEPPEGQQVPRYLPGQFLFLTFFRGDEFDGEEHHFTISSSPTRPQRLTSTIKESGDFTATIGQTKEDDTVRVTGPYGRFSYLLHPKEQSLVLIAGGIGITPLMAMLRHMADTNAERDVLLIYANESEEDIVFRQELDELEGARAPTLKVVHLLASPPPSWVGKRGFVNSEMIRRHVGDQLAGHSFYVCGPPPMMDKVTRELRDLGVPAKRIHTERFAL